jgi:hypothetical protein
LHEAQPEARLALFEQKAGFAQYFACPSASDDSLLASLLHGIFMQEDTIPGKKGRAGRFPLHKVRAPLVLLGPYAWRDVRTLPRDR